MREQLLKKLADIHAKKPWMMIFVVLIITMIFAGLSTRLSMTMRWSDLLPSNDPRTVEFNNIIDEFVSATSLIVVIQGEEDKIKSYAEHIVPIIQTLEDTSRNEKSQSKIQKNIDKIALAKKKNDTEKVNKLLSENISLKNNINKKLIKRIDYKNEADFIKNHGLMLIKQDDLKNLMHVFTDPNLTGFVTNLNNSLEKEYTGRDESLSTREKEDQAIATLDAVKDFVLLVDQYGKTGKISDDKVHEVVDKFLIGEPYFLSYDKSALILNVIPNFTMMDADYMVTCTDAVQKIIDQSQSSYPDVKVGLTGMIAVGRDEMVYSEQSLGITSVVAFIAILIMLMISFRMLTAPLLAGLNLVIGIIWATGMAAVAVGELNFMTSMFAVILIGLGIDFSIHLISGFTEKTSEGKSIQEAMEQTFLKSGKGIITGGLTTATAFLTLIISGSRGMKEMGIVSGLGLIAILVSTLLFLPSLLTIRQRFMLRVKNNQKTPQSKDLSFQFLGNIAQKFEKNYIFTLVGAGIVTIFLFIYAMEIKFDHNYMNIEPEGLTSIALQDTILEKFDMSMDYGLALANSSQESNKLAKGYKKLSSVASVEDISAYLPSNEDQLARKYLIEKIRKEMLNSNIKSRILPNDFDNLIKQIARLEENVIEIQDMAFLGGQDKVDNKCKELVGEPDKENSSLIAQILARLEKNPQVALQNLQDFQKQFSPYYKSSVLQMTNTEQITINSLPESILDRYCNKKRDKFLVTVFPSGNVWQDSKFFRPICR